MLSTLDGCLVPASHIQPPDLQLEEQSEITVVLSHTLLSSAFADLILAIKNCHLVEARNFVVVSPHQRARIGCYVLSAGGTVRNRQQRRISSDAENSTWYICYKYRSVRPSSTHKSIRTFMHVFFLGCLTFWS